MTDVDVRSSPPSGDDPLHGLAAPSWPGTAPVPGVPLADLLARVRLTTAQAMVLARDALQALVDAWSDGRVLDRPTPDRVHVTVEGRLRLPVTDPGGPPGVPERRVDAAAVAGLLTAVLAVTSQPAGGAAWRALLERAGRVRDGAGVTRLADELQRVAGDRLESGRAELSVLVARLAAAEVTAAQHTIPARSLPMPAAARPGHRVWSGLVRSVALLLALVIVLGAEYALLGDRVIQDLQRLTGGSGSSTTSAARPVERSRSSPPKPVPTLAPRAAGAVTALDLRALQPCRPGRTCEARLLVSVRPQHQPLIVRWSLTLIDRCTGTRSTQPGGALRVPAGAQQATALTRIPLPNRPVLAAVALTSAPARTAAPAMPVPAAGGSCPAS